MSDALESMPATAAGEAAARAAGATKVYGSGATAVTALNGVTVEFESGRFSAIMGPSGSGKSTLLHCVAGLDRLTSGRLWVGEADLTTLDDKALTKLRRDRIGFVFQAFNLVPTLTALENITLPGALAGRRSDEDWLAKIIDTLALRDRLARASPERALGRPAAAGRHRPGAQQPAGNHLRRRAHREPRFPGER